MATETKAAPKKSKFDKAWWKTKTLSGLAAGKRIGGYIGTSALSGLLAVGTFYGAKAAWTKITK